MPAVTMSGTMGSGARDVGLRVAELLGCDYVDQQIMVDAARRLGVSTEMVVERDERCLGFREKMAHMLRSFLERSAAAGAGDPLMGSGGLEMLLGRTYTDLGADAGSAEQELDDSLYAKTITAIIQDLGRRDNIVILGRGSQMILRDLPHALHVLTLAPLEVRIPRYAEREGITPEEACKKVQELDRARLDFHRKFFKADANDPSLYDLVIDTSRLPYPAAAEVIALAARAKSSASS
jgi:cytidylate kinase